MKRSASGAAVSPTASPCGSDLSSGLSASGGQTFGSPAKATPRKAQRRGAAAARAGTDSGAVEALDEAAELAEAEAKAKGSPRQSSDLARAVAAGVLPKARRPFALFIATNWPKGGRLSQAAHRETMGRLAAEWAALSASAKAMWQAKSQAEFCRRAEEAALRGITCRRGQPVRRLPPAVPEGPAVPEQLAVHAVPAVISFGEYMLKDELGSGTFGQVLAGYSTRTGRGVALKIFQCVCKEDAERELLHYQLVQRYINEKKREQLIVRMLQAQLEAPLPFFAFEMRGTSLRAHLVEHGKLTVEAVSAVAFQLLAGIRLLHEATLLHLDLKPGNILWDHRDMHLHIIDLGNSEQLPLDGPLNFSHYVTEGYRPLELYLRSEDKKDVLRSRLGPAVDYWSCGCIVFEAAAGQPFISMRTRMSSSSCVKGRLHSWHSVHASLFRQRLAFEPGDLQYWRRRLALLPTSGFRRLLATSLLHPEPDSWLISPERAQELLRLET